MACLRLIYLISDLWFKSRCLRFANISIFYGKVVFGIIEMEKKLNKWKIELTWIKNFNWNIDLYLDVGQWN